MPRLLPVLLTLLIAACSGGARDDGPKGPPPVSVSLETARITPIEQRARALAVVEAINAPDVVAEVDGRVIAVLADVGQSVHAGQPLARLDSADAASKRLAAEADVARLAALAGQAESEWRRGRELAGQGFISASAVDDLAAKAHAARAQHAAASAQAAQARRDAARTTVLAPIAGRIDARLVGVGDYATAGKPLFVLSGEQGGLRLRLGLTGRDPQAIRPGLMVRVYRDNAGPLDVQVSDVRPAVDSNSGAIIALAALPAGSGLTAGQALPADLVLARRDALSVPQISVVDRPAGRVVYVAAGSKVSAHPVKTGIEQDGRIEILDGLKAGDRVVADGAGFLTDGAAIRDKSARPEAAR